MDLKDIIAKDRKDSAIEFAQWIVYNGFTFIEGRDVWQDWSEEPGIYDIEELYELFLKEKG